ncbi:DeoR/GlpR family DNA-binding transcription regulator [Numidum massiliense]|uniref:DeoR/GlpR family DNA-binding transcription regulator n=1 Tax=Numidum massiliense TaxID=1522315 RepID=UPI0006D5836B|nr:DeoR/GlpR family DNA-binding transcription regulator [Numidum massiliense]
MSKLPERRRQEILDILETTDYAEFSFLSERFSVSEMTIRRDIDKLEDEGKIIRVYGGVRLKEKRVYDGLLEDRLRTHVNEKKKIAYEALQLIEDGDVVAFDASTTALELSRLIKFKKKVTVITNNISITVELSADPEITVILLGGFLRRGSLSLIGSSMQHYLQSLYIDKAFISCKALDFTEGVTDSAIDEGEAKQAIIERSNKVYVLADHSKIGTLAFFKICPAERIDGIITDQEQPFTERQRQCLADFRANGVEVIMAPPPKE